MNFSKGQFWDVTANAFRGCSHISDGCAHCWAERFAVRLAANPKTKYLYEELIKDGKWTGETRYNKDWWRPLSFFQERKPLRILFNCMGDLFHSKNAAIQVQDCLWRMGWTLNHHSFIVPTKRTINARAALEVYVADAAPIKNLCLLASVSNQDADKQIPFLLACKPYVAGIGIIAEPLLEEVVIDLPALKQCSWLICGAESGPGARPMDIDWARSLYEQAQEAGIPFFLKSCGKGKGRILDGVEHNALPLWNPE